MQKLNAIPNRAIVSTVINYTSNLKADAVVVPVCLSHLLSYVDLQIIPLLFMSII